MDIARMVYLRKLGKIAIWIVFQLLALTLIIICGLLMFPLIGGLIDIIKEPYFYKNLRFYILLFFAIINLNILIYGPFSFFHRLVYRKHNGE